jgi:hypothetical protein
MQAGIQLKGVALRGMVKHPVPSDGLVALRHKAAKALTPRKANFHLMTEQAL